MDIIAVGRKQVDLKIVASIICHGVKMDIDKLYYVDGFKKDEKRQQGRCQGRCREERFTGTATWH